MGCFAVQKAKKILGERAAGLNEVTTTESESASTSEAPFSPSSSKSSGLSPVRRFRRTVKTIQNAQKFISHSKSGPRSANHVHGLDSPEQGVSPGHMNYGSQPMPLPSPRPRLNPTRYALPHPFEQVDSNIASPKSTEASHASLHSRIFPYELQPLPLPKAASTTVPRGLKSFTFDELADACQNFSDEALVDDDGVFFHGSIHTCSNGSDANRQKVVVLHLDDKLHLGLKDWLPELYPSDHPPSAFICKLVGFHDACTTERLLVYEYLARGSLYSLLFNTSGASSLDWPARIKIIHGAVEGLVSLEERFPDNVLYKDFRLSHIQVDDENNAKVCGYWFVTSNSQNVQAYLSRNSKNKRDNAYCAPETRSQGVLTWKSTVWSLGITILEILCGRQNKDERAKKNDFDDLVKWSRPYLLEEDKLFLIMDPKLQGRFQTKGAKIMACLILQCLQEEPSRRPNMKAVLSMVKASQETKHVKASTWKERPESKVSIHSSAPLFHLASSEPVKHATTDSSSLAYISSPENIKFGRSRSPTQFDIIRSPALRPLSIPPRSNAE